MGRSREFACPSCSASWQLFLGHGMGHATLENVLDEFPADIQQKILADTKDEKIPSFEFNFCPAVCRQCKKVIAVPVIYLHHSEQTYFAPCPDCGSTVDIFKEDEDTRCPFCGEGLLSLSDIGSWD